jgi:hypothetical protein
MLPIGPSRNRDVNFLDSMHLLCFRYIPDLIPPHSYNLLESQISIPSRRIIMSRLFKLAMGAVVLIAATQTGADERKTDINLIGTWKMVSAKYNGKQRKLPDNETTLKHVTPTQMIWLTFNKDGKITRAAGGPYTLKGDEYTDTPEYGLSSDFDVVKGKTHMFKCKVEGKTWYHTGKLATGLVVEEVWERVEKK